MQSATFDPTPKNVSNSSFISFSFLLFFKSIKYYSPPLFFISLTLETIYFALYPKPKSLKSYSVACNNFSTVGKE